MKNIELLQMADDVRKNCKVPFSNYHVGAALLTKNGKVYTGCNFEHPTSIAFLNMCAERIAFLKAISEGEDEFEKIAVVGGINRSIEYTTPCGVCRQFMLSFNEDLVVVCRKGEEVVEFLLKDLLPDAFNKKF